MEKRNVVNTVLKVGLILVLLTVGYHLQFWQTTDWGDLRDQETFHNETVVVELWRSTESYRLEFIFKDPGRYMISGTGSIALNLSLSTTTAPHLYVIEFEGHAPEIHLELQKNDIMEYGALADI